MPDDTVTATEFQTRAGKYIELSGKAPVTITKHNRPARVLLDFAEYERLRAYDQRRAFHANEMDDQTGAELENAEMDPRHAHLDDLMVDD